MGGNNSGKRAARTEGEQARLTAQQTTYADRPDQYNPFSTLTWDTEVITDPQTGERVTKWIQKQGLTDDAQALYDSDYGNITAMNALRDQAMARAGQEMAGAPDWAQFGSAQGLEYDPTELRQRAEDAAYQSQTSRLDPQFEQRARDMETTLRNRGLRPGDEAYDNAMAGFNRSRNDAYEQARLSSVGVGRDEAGQLFNQQVTSTDMANALRDKQIQEYLGKRNFSLDEAERLNTAQQVQDLQTNYAGGGG